MTETAAQIITRVGVYLSSRLAPEELMTAVVGEVGRAMQSATCCLYDFSAAYGLLTLVAQWSIDDDPDLQALVGTSFTPDSRPSLSAVVGNQRTVEMHVNDPGLSSQARDDLWNDLTSIATPLMSGQELIGVLALGEKGIRHFSEPERELFEELAAIVATAVRNAHRFSQQEDQNRHLGSLLEASRAVSSSVVLDEVLSIVVTKTAEALGVARCRIYEYDRGADTITERAAFVSDPRAEQSPPPPDPDDPGSILRRALETGEIVSERLVRPSETRKRLRRRVPEQLQTRLALPLIFAGDPVGVMALLEPRGEREFTVAELELARGLAEQGAAAIQNVRLYQRLQEQAITDGLTGLANHRHFYESLHNEVARAHRYESPLSLLVIDIDDFKQFNDAHGHQLGDEALRLVARVLKTRLREKIDLPARYGGEEFTVILPSTPLEGAAVAASRLAEDVGRMSAQPSPTPPQPGDGGAEAIGERLRAGIEAESAHVHVLPESITVSVGGAQLAPGWDADRLVAAADQALYEAKRAGKNCVRVVPGPAAG